MECIHLKVITKHVAECKVLQELGLEHIPGPGRSGFPCETCKSQWKNNTPPDKDNITTVMAKSLAYGKKMPLPTVIEQFQNLGTDGLKWASSGFPTTSEEEYQERLSVCKENKCGQYDEASKRCFACGCFVEEAAHLATKECPAGLWRKLSLASRTVGGNCGGCGKV